MGDVINLAEHRAARRRQACPRDAEFFFDLACPSTYLAAERVERAFGQVVWTPASGAALGTGSAPADGDELERLRRHAEDRAARLRLPLSWPEQFPAPVPAAMRAAGYAAEQGRAAPFVLAAVRLAFCGGFDLDDPEILAEAAAAAGVVLDDCLIAARDEGRDGAIERAGRALLAAGADRLPALRVGRALYWGESRVGEALAAARVARVAQV
jgi:2-hydroxychromene-2-carboxylate isomerase